MDKKTLKLIKNQDSSFIENNISYGNIFNNHKNYNKKQLLVENNLQEKEI